MWCVCDCECVEVMCMGEIVYSVRNYVDEDWIEGVHWDNRKEE
jgi:hypothetical protein